MTPDLKADWGLRESQPTADRETQIFPFVSLRFIAFHGDKEGERVVNGVVDVVETSHKASVGEDNRQDQLDMSNDSSVVCAEPAVFHATLSQR